DVIFTPSEDFISSRIEFSTSRWLGLQPQTSKEKRTIGTRRTKRFNIGTPPQGSDHEEHSSSSLQVGAWWIATRPLSFVKNGGEPFRPPCAGGGFDARLAQDVPGLV